MVENLEYIKEYRRRDNYFVIFKCMCGKELRITKDGWESGLARRCRRCRLKSLSVKTDDEMIGKQFGHWLVIERQKYSGELNYMRSDKYICKCSCGIIKPVYLKHLRVMTKDSRCIKCRNNAVKINYRSDFIV